VVSRGKEMVNAILKATPFQWFKKRAKALHARRQLQQLTDRELMDIGIQRHEIDSVTRY
jgi:uncharacterized protein YjiS (DUF1127 family)